MKFYMKGIVFATMATTSIYSFAAPENIANSERVKKVIEHWTPARRAAAIPRDFVIDRAGRGFLKLPNGRLVPLSNEQTVRKGKPSSSDTTPPEISNLSPASNEIVGSKTTFAAVITDDSAIKSVSFTIKKGPDGFANLISPTQTTPDVWEAAVEFPTNGDGAWQWQIVAKDTGANGGNISTTDWYNFTVTSNGTDGSNNGGGTDSGTGGTTGSSVVTNGHWNFDEGLRQAVGRIYFEMPANKRGTRWNGYVCSGTVVTNGSVDYDLIITAAHCLYDDVNKTFANNVLFIPNQNDTTGNGTDTNCDNDPVGCWAPEFGVVDANWTTRTFPDNIPWDYGYYAVPVSGAHKGAPANNESLLLATGGFTEEFDTPSLGFEHALGYSYSEDPSLMYCAEDVQELNLDNWWLSQCGMSGGSSGGPWAMDVSYSGSEPITVDAKIYSVNSWGYTTQPGMAGPKLNGSAEQLKTCALNSFVEPGTDRGKIFIDSRCQ